MCAIAVSSFAAGVWENIPVLRNDIKVIVNGEEITADNFLYNDTTYLPLRAIGEALDKDVQYDEQTNTAIINEKGDSELTENINKHTPPDFMIGDEYYITQTYSGKYVAGIRCIAYFTDPMGLELYFPNESNEIVFYKNGVEVYRYQYSEDGRIYYDELMDEIIPALEALQ